MFDYPGHLCSNIWNTSLTDKLPPRRSKRGKTKQFLLIGMGTPTPFGFPVMLCGPIPFLSCKPSQWPTLRSIFASRVDPCRSFRRILFDFAALLLKISK